MDNSCPSPVIASIVLPTSTGADSRPQPGMAAAIPIANVLLQNVRLCMLDPPNDSYYR